jgi:hypothetical protein
MDQSQNGHFLLMIMALILSKNLEIARNVGIPA